MCKTKLKYEFKCFMYIQKAPQLETWAKFSQVENQASSNGVAIDFNNYRKFYAELQPQIVYKLILLKL